MSESMSESKIELTERLRREGRWSVASKWKDELVGSLRAGGMKRNEASDEAWRRLAAEYPPLPPDPEPATEPVEDGAEVPVSASPLPDVWDEIADSAPFEVEVEWVHQNRVLVIEDRTGRSSRLHWERARSPAPSYGAVNLMEYAATNRKGFMDILQRVKPGMNADEENVRREKTKVEEIRRILEELREAKDEKLLADVPQVVQDRVQALLADWSREHDLVLSSDATAALKARVAGLVQECMDATAKEAEEVRKAADVREVIAGIGRRE